MKGQQRIAGMERQTVNHGSGEFVRGDVYTNAAEGFIRLLKRGIVGTFYHVGKGTLGSTSRSSSSGTTPARSRTRTVPF